MLVPDALANVNNENAAPHGSLGRDVVGDMDDAEMRAVLRDKTQQR